jgi:hypothetical protein
MSLKRKPRSNSKLESLLPKQKDQLEQWLLGNMGYGQAVALVEKQFNLVTSETAIGRFWESYVSPRRLVRRQRSAQLADQMVEEIAQRPGQWDQALKDALKETAFNLLQSPNPSTEDVMFIMGCVAKSKDQELKETDIRLKRDKFEFDAAKAALKHLDALREIKARKGMDQNERLRQARLRLFGTAPE